MRSIVVAASLAPLKTVTRPQVLNANSDTRCWGGEWRGCSMKLRGCEWHQRGIARPLEESRAAQALGYALECRWYGHKFPVALGCSRCLSERCVGRVSRCSACTHFQACSVEDSVFLWLGDLWSATQLHGTKAWHAVCWLASAHWGCCLGRKCPLT